MTAMEGHHVYRHASYSKLSKDCWRRHGVTATVVTMSTDMLPTVV